MPYEGGDPAVGSPTATLLRLSPPHSPLARPRPFRNGASPRGRLGGLTGGVCKEQGRIHRGMMNPDYWGFRLHEGELQPSIRTTTGFRGFAPPFGVASHCPGHCDPRVAQGIRGMQTYRRPPLPPAPRRQSPQSALAPTGPGSNWGHGSRSLPRLGGHLTARAVGGHAPPLGSSGKAFSLTFILPLALVRFPALNPIEPQVPPLVVPPRQFLQVSALRPYSPGGGLNGFPPALQAPEGPARPSPHSLQPGLPGYLIRFAPPAFVPHRRTRSRRAPSPPVVLPGS